MKKIWLFFIVFFLFILDGYAETDINFACPRETMVGNKITCDLRLVNESEMIMGVQIEYQSNNIFSYLDTTIIRPWSVINANGFGLIAVNVNDGDDDGSAVVMNSDIAQTSFMISKQAEIGKSYELKLKNIQISNGENDIDILEKSYPIKILSVHDIVDTLEINGVSLNLQDGVDSYTVEVDSDIVEISSNLKKDTYYFSDEFGPRTIENVSVGEHQELLKIMLDDQELLTFTLNIRKVDSQDKEENIENPKTGNHYIIGIMIILLGSAVMIFCYNEKIRKGRIS